MGVWAAACGDATVVVQPVGCRSTSGHREIDTGLGLSGLTVHCGRTEPLDRSVSWNGVNCNRDTAGQLPAEGDQAPPSGRKHLCAGSALDHVHQQKRVLALLHPQRVAGRPLLPVLRWLSAHLPTSTASGSSFLFPAVSFKGYLRCLCPRYSLSTLSSLITHISCSFMVVLGD